MANGGGSDGSCHYSVLGIRKEASLTDIRKAYRKLALRWHPDRMTKNPSMAGDANRRFQRIQEAYSVLSDEGKRSMYDAGTLDLFDEEDDGDEGMGEFMHDLFKMMDKNNNSRVGAGGEVGRKEESLEDLQRCFMETFGADLATYLNNTTTVQDDQHSYHPYPHPPKTTTTTRSHHTTPYARATPKTRPTTTTTNSSTSTTSRAC